MTTTSRHLSTRRLLAAVLAAGAALTASGCSAGGIDAGAAAIVGDRRISVSDVQTATTQVNAIADPDGSQPDNRFAQRDVLALLISEPYVLAVAAQNGVGVSENDARGVFRQFNFKDPQTGTTTPAQASLDLVRSVLARQRLNPQQDGSGLSQDQATAAYTEVSKRLTATDIRVNPRFGTFDATFDAARQGGQFVISKSEPDWFVPSEARPTPTPSQ